VVADHTRRPAVAASRQTLQTWSSAGQIPRESTGPPLRQAARRQKPLEAPTTSRGRAPGRAGQAATAAVVAGGEAARVHGLVLVVGEWVGVLAAAREAAWRDARGGYRGGCCRSGGGGGEAQVPARVAVTWALLDAPPPVARPVDT
jgi:hypothetical protein